MLSVHVALAAAWLLMQAGETPAPSRDARAASIEVARSLAESSKANRLELSGKVTLEWDKNAPTFSFPAGASPAVLVQLPEYQEPYLVTVVTRRRGLGRTTEVFVPKGFLLDDRFDSVAAIEEVHFGGRVESLAAEFPIREAHRRARYVFLFTDAERVGEQLRISGPDALSDALFGLMQKGLFRLERSIDAKLEFTARPLPTHAGVPTATPADIVRGAVERHSVVEVTPKKVTHVLDDRTPRFMAGPGPTTVAVLRLPTFTSPYVLSLRSAMGRVGLFVPSGLILDDQFETVARFEERQLTGRDDLRLQLTINETFRAARYVLVHTRGDLVGTSIARGRSPVVWVPRVLDGRLEIETRPAKE